MGVGMVVGAFLTGFIQDKFGHKAATTMLLTEIILMNTILIIQNEYLVFNWTAHLFMFGQGVIYNSQRCFLHVILGFEFDSKIVPFGAKNFVETLGNFFTIIGLSIWNIEN